jgi:hypothetical protein
VSTFEEGIGGGDFERLSLFNRIRKANMLKEYAKPFEQLLKWVRGGWSWMGSKGEGEPPSFINHVTPLMRRIIT